MVKEVTRKLFKGDKIVWAVFFILCALSLVEVFSASSRMTYEMGSYWKPITKHAIFLIAGVCVVWFIHNMKIEWIKSFSKFVYIVGVVLLVYTLLSGNRVNDSSRWVTLLGIRFQPSEIAKMGIMMMTSLILAKAQTSNGTFLSLKDAMSLIYLRPQKEDNTKDYTMLTIIIVAIIPSILILLENLSTVIIIGASLLAMMFIGCIKGKHIIILLVTGIIVGALGFTIIIRTPDSAKHGSAFERKMLTWKNRLVDDDNSEKTLTPKEFYKNAIKNGDHQNLYSKLAIGTSSLFGKGPGKSVQRDFIPLAHSDFIYSIIIEELGLIGGIVVLLLYLTLLFRSGRIASRCEDPYSAFLVIGISTIITVQALMHMFISVSDFVTGQPLPLVSQGGTAILINCVYIGIILCVSREAKRLEREKQKEEASINQ